MLAPRTEHHRPSNPAKSGPLPLAFLRGVGLPDNLIDYLPSLLNQPIQFYSCFISYSSKDQEFADRLHADLQNKGVRCWFAPARHADRRQDHRRHRRGDPAARQGAADPVRECRRQRLGRGRGDQGLAEERERKQIVLFPIRLDDAVMKTTKPWARMLRDQRNIGDFTRWKDHDAYRKASSGCCAT